MTEKKTLTDGRKLYAVKAGKPEVEPSEPEESTEPGSLAAGVKLYQNKNNK